MHQSFKAAIAGTLAIAGVAMATVDVQAMPIQPLSPAASSVSIDKVWWRGGYVWHRPFYGYGWRRPFVGYGWGWGWRRPFYGYRYGWRRPYYGWRRW